MAGARGSALHFGPETTTTRCRVLCRPKPNGLLKKFSNQGAGSPFFKGPPAPYYINDVTFARFGRFHDTVRLQGPTHEIMGRAIVGQI